jgi:hypothetical protein
MGKIGENSAHIAAIVDKKIKEAITTLAKSEKRTMSQMTGILLEEALEARRKREQVSPHTTAS